MEREHGPRETFYALNEALVGDKHPARVASSFLTVDGVESEVASRGVMVSSGSGSTGWLASARWKAAADVKRIFKQAGAELPTEATQTITDRINRTI